MLFSSSSSRYPREGSGRIALPATTTSGRIRKQARWWLAWASTTAAALLAAPTPTTASTDTAVAHDTSPLPSSNYPSLDLVQSILRTTAQQDFADHHGAYAAAHDWQRQRLLNNNINNNKAAPYLACAEYGQGLEARASLEQEFGPSSVHTVSHSATHGACFVATAVPSAAEALLQNPSRFRLKAAGPFLSVLKIAPGLLDHGAAAASDNNDLHNDGGDEESEKMFEGKHVLLRTKHGNTVALDGVRGLSVKLSPGTAMTRQPERLELASNWHSGLMSR